MTATITGWKRFGSDAWEVTWSGTSPFRIYRDGVYVDGNPTTDTSRIFTVTDGEEPPALEILDSTQTTDPESVTYSPLVVIQWRAFLGANHYLVQKYIASTWTTQRKVGESGRGYYRYTSDAQDDVTTHQFRVVAVDSDGNQDTSLSFAAFMVRNPPPPSVTVAWDEGDSEIDITARA